MTESRSGLAWVMAALGFWAAWLASMALKIPRIWYLPLERRFAIAVESSGGMAMGFYGQLVNAALIAACTGGITWAIVRDRHVTPSQVWAGVVACALLLAVTIFFIGAGLWGRVPS